VEIKSTKLISQVRKSSRSYLEERGYVEVAVPRIVRASGACENINTLFEVSVDGDFTWFSRRKGYLAQTGQLYLEAMVPDLGRVYCSGSSFRAEPRADNRHLIEFQLLEIEFSGDFDQLLDEIQGLVQRVASDLLKHDDPENEFDLKERDLKRLENSLQEFPRLTYDGAIELLNDLGEEISWGQDIPPHMEQRMTANFGERPVFITRFPDPCWSFDKEIEVEKFFNMLPDPDNPGRVLSCDLIMPFGGEAVGAAARVHQAETLTHRLAHSRMFRRLVEKGGGWDDFQWYLDRIKQNGCVPHVGGGFGLSRIIQFIRGSTDIRECVSFVSNKEVLI
jgi:asparaginyl-tRNA synthetase